MLLLLILSAEDTQEDQLRFARLPELRGHQVKVVQEKNISTAADIQLIGAKVKAEAVICCSATVLKMILQIQYDYNLPDSRKDITLDDYAGSILELHSIPRVAEGKEVLVLNSLRHLLTVPYATYLFNRYITKLTKPGSWYPQTVFKWEILDVTNLQRCAELLHLFANSDFISDDIETAIGDPERRITVVGFCSYSKANHTTLSIVIPFDSVEAWSWAKRFAELPVRKVFQNGLYDCTYKARWNCLPSHWFWDTQSLFHCWYSELPKRLDFITAFAIRKIRYWKDDGSTGNLQDYYRYNALDTWATINAVLSLIYEMPQWAVDNYLQEFPLHFPALQCNLEGLAIDKPKLLSVLADKKVKHEANLSRLRYLFNSPDFNPGSSAQVVRLFTVLGIRLAPDRWTGKVSSGKIVMQKARATTSFNDMVLGWVVDYKKENKLLTTYFIPEKFWLDRLFYSLNPAATDTGRFACNASAFWCGLQIQNIPAGDSVKQCIVADPGWLLSEIDKAQSEARCVGYLSGEEKLIAAVEGPNDFHSWNASSFFGLPYETIYSNEKKKTLDKDIRDLSKRTNHGANYNMGDNVMVDTMGPKHVTRAKKLLKLPAHFSLRRVAAYLLERYSATYPKVKGQWYTSIVKRILLSKKLVSPYGWTRYFFGRPDLNKQDLNSAVAHEPQNLSVSIINREFYTIWRAQVYGELRGLIRLKAQIHDSIFFQYRYPFNPEYIRNKYMNTTVQVTAPDGITRSMFIPSDVSSGRAVWSEIK